jgi:ABC-type multidrug transport system fused ATPase/permease subunit
LNEVENPKTTPPKQSLSFFELMWVLSPYFWPEKGSDGALINRVRSTSTWLMVVLSKTCNLYAPFFLSSATNELLNKQFGAAVKNLIVYCTLRLLSSFFKELQSIIYIKVKQQATIQLQELTFSHLHSLSLNWHLSKKTGSVMKSMDRGTDAANQLITYLFLMLIPAMVECLAVVILFFAQYKQWLLGVIVLTGVSLYSFATIVITNWRKKFREETNKHDNDYHNKATDSIINYETVKYFTGLFIYFC